MWDIQINVSERRRLFHKMMSYHRPEVTISRLKWRPAAQHLIEHYSQAVDVRLSIIWLIIQSFWRHICGSAQELSRSRQALNIYAACVTHQLCYSEVYYLYHFSFRTLMK